MKPADGDRHLNARPDIAVRVRDGFIIAATQWCWDTTKVCANVLIASWQAED